LIQVIDLKTMKKEAPPTASVLCLGNFDGVHLGHRALVRETVRQKGILSPTLEGLASGAWLFREPPSRILSNTPVPQLTTLEEKLGHFAALGLDYAFLADFSALRELEPAEFVEKVLKQECHCVYAVCGFDFSFAKRAMGHAEDLVRLMDGQGSILECVSVGEQCISSSAIRAFLAEGKIEEANAMLGYPFALTAPVVRGKALGKTIGVPTVNQLFTRGTARLRDGIYVSRTELGGVCYPSVTNIGYRPTFDDGEHVNCETHIIGYGGDLYGKTLKVEFFKRLRDEIRFPSVEALREQLRADIAAAQSYFEK